MTTEAVPREAVCSCGFFKGDTDFHQPWCTWYGTGQRPAEAKCIEFGCDNGWIHGGSPLHHQGTYVDPCPRCNPTHPLFTKGAVSVVKPQGTEETGTDRPAAPSPLVAQEQVRRWRCWYSEMQQHGHARGSTDWLMVPAEDHDRVVSELKRESDNLRVIVGTVERDYKERLATERAAHAATREILAFAFEALKDLAERPKGYHDCSDYERGYGDAWAAKASMATAALKNLDAALAAHSAAGATRADGQKEGGGKV